MRMRAVESCVECGVRSAECGGCAPSGPSFFFSLFLRLSLSGRRFSGVSLDNELSRYYTTYPRPKNRLEL